MINERSEIFIRYPLIAGHDIAYAKNIHAAAVTTQQHGVDIMQDFYTIFHWKL